MMMPVRRMGIGRLGDQSVTDIITQAAQAQGVPAALALAQAQHESSLNPSATHQEVNGCIAYGLFQLEDCYFSGQGDLTDPTINANVALAYLSQLNTKYGGWYNALMAYNEGTSNFEKGDQASAGYAAAILAAAGMNVTGGTTTPPATSAPAPAAGPPAPPQAPTPSPAPAAGPSLATMALIAVAGIFALDTLS